MTLHIAREDGKIGVASANIQASIVLGRRIGYEGPVQSTDEILNGLGELQREERSREETPLLFIITEGTIAYLNEHDEPVREPCLLLSADRSPLYSEDTESAWKSRVEWYAEKLADAFKQVRVHVTYAKVETRVFES